jgi:Glycosyltransferases, probably involved in cell wall biogenesis
MGKHEGGLRVNGINKESFKDRPLISIITVIYNAKNHIEKTINSVLDQTYDSIEYIIVDGGSTDGSLEIIKKYDGSIDYWISEKDKGIYDAMNKGLFLAKGSWIGMLNAGDTYYKDAIETIANTLRDDTNAGVIYADINYKIYDIIIRIKSPAKLSLSQFWKMPIYHPAMFVSKNTFEKYGGFSIEYSLASDYELLLRLFKKGVKCLYIGTVLTEMESGGASSKKYKKGLEELYAVAKSHHIVDFNFLLKYRVNFIKTILTQKCFKSKLATKFYKSYKNA